MSTTPFVFSPAAARWAASLAPGTSLIRVVFFASALCCWPMGWSGAGAAAAQEAGPETAGNPYLSLAAKAEALVTVSYVAELRAPGVDREAENEATCLGIDPAGLVLCSNTEVGGYFDVLARLMGRSGDVISSRPREVRIKVGDDPEGWPASVIARDSDRDLAWVRADSMPEGAVLPSIRLEHQAEAEVGQRFYQLRVLDRFFGSAPVVREAVVAAIIDRPRRLIVPSEPGGGRLGMPAFTADGRLLGLTVAQVPESGESAAVMGERRRSLPGQEDLVDDMVSGMLLPADELLSATRLAREVWAADRDEGLE
ncbi:MAG: hypothetical protein MI919_32615 [Holophagales bacterium]|nr:hypothetical protein [Holophagales bacterium]